MLESAAARLGSGEAEGATDDDDDDGDADDDGDSDDEGDAEDDEGNAEDDDGDSDEDEALEGLHAEALAKPAQRRPKMTLAFIVAQRMKISKRIESRKGERR